MTGKNGYILFHKGTVAPAFDIIVREDYYKRNKEFFDKLKEELYSTECIIAKKFIEEKKEYIYLGSEDLNHYWDDTVYLISKICELVKEHNFKIVLVEENGKEREIEEEE